MTVTPGNANGSPVDREDFESRIREDLASLGMIKNILSLGSYTAQITMYGWRNSVVITARWNPLTRSMNYFNSLERQIVLHPKVRSARSAEVFQRLHDASSIIGRKGEPFGLKVMIAMALWFPASGMLSLPLILLGHTETFFWMLMAGWMVGFVILGTNRSRMRKKAALAFGTSWNDTRWETFDKDVWNTNPDSVTRCLFLDDGERKLFIEDLVTVAKSNGVVYHGNLRVGPHVHRGSTGAVSTNDFPALMSYPVFLFDGSVSGPNDMKVVAWNGFRFFYSFPYTRTEQFLSEDVDRNVHISGVNYNRVRNACQVDENGTVTVTGQRTASELEINPTIEVFPA